MKQRLYVAQHKKCAWCEVKAPFSSSPVEHYRPKNGAQRSPRRVRPRAIDAAHYWWLTWTWENLLFSCVRCNDSGHKANHFWLASNTSACTPLPRPGTPASAADGDVSTEQALLLDPTVDSFLDHVRWRPANTAMARKRWIWVPDGLTPRGDATIAMLELGQLAEEVQGHLLRAVLPLVEQLEHHVRGKRSRQAADTWRALLRTVEPTEPYTAATWCALELWVDAATRAAWKLADPPRPR